MIYIGCDHGGVHLKNVIVSYFEKEKIDYQDFGTSSNDSVDYPKFAELVANSVTLDDSNRGILICGTGIGVSIAANKVKDIRAALCHSVHYADMARRHNNANVLCLGGRELNDVEAVNIVKTFLSTKFEGGRHQRRILQISKIEQNKL